MSAARFPASGGGLRFFGPKGINPYVESYLRSIPGSLEGKTVVDVPAGSGQMSAIMKSLGARVEAYDLFPDSFKADGLECRKADLSEALPIESGAADYILCQEGIEHVPNQVMMLREFSRVLKDGGTLLITTPNYSNLRIKMGQLLSESEYAVKRMPPNEIDSVWGRSGSDEPYYGHVFPVGIQKLRFLAGIAGLSVRKVHHTRVNGSSLALLFLFYPLILFSNILAYSRALSKKRAVSRDRKRQVYGEVLKYGIDPGILVDGYLFVEFVKEREKV
jgi:SAM-dependent methyltransferase